jgi:hypothetical protein
VNEPTLAKAVLVPPRPNLGPEPLPRRLDTLELALIVAAAALGLMGLAVALRRLGRQRRGMGPDPARPTLPEGPFATRREQMAAWSGVVRETLSLRFGDRWRARTTEEIASDPGLAEALGPEAAARLVRFLAESDRAKFDDREGLQSPLSGDPPGPGLDLDWVAGFIAASVPAAGARSRITGR